MKTLNYKGYSIKIEQDINPDNPREWDNLATMAFFHKRYNLGDSTHNINCDDYNNWVEMRQAIIKEFKPVCIAPVSMYDHSGITIKIGDFNGLLPEGHAHFDSGIIGYIFVSAENAKKEWGSKRISQKIKNDCIRIMKSEVETYNQYLTGDVYGFTITKDNKDIDSCWGFYGYEYCQKETKDIVDYNIKEEKKNHFKKVKQWITNKVPFEYRKVMPIII